MASCMTSAVKDGKPMWFSEYASTVIEHRRCGSVVHQGGRRAQLGLRDWTGRTSLLPFHSAATKIPDTTTSGPSTSGFLQVLRQAKESEGKTVSENRMWSF